MEIDTEEPWISLVDLFREDIADIVSHDRTLQSGVITQLSASACHMRDAVTGNIVAIQFPWQRRTQHIVGVVDEASCIRICVETVGSTVYRCLLEVQPNSIEAALHAAIPLPGEAHFVALIAASWSEIVILPHRQPIVVESHQRSDATRAMWPHQQASLEFMQCMEAASCSLPLTYAQNLRICESWYVDPFAECITPDPTWREAHARGGILSDWAGSGKTTAMLRHCTRDIGGPTLIIVPLNLVEQWQSEARGACPDAHMIFMLTGRDARSTAMSDVARASVVLTTLQFLRQSRVYQQVSEEAVSRVVNIDRRYARCRSALRTYARVHAPTDPALLECVSWRRIVVDELHEAFSDLRNVKCVEMLHTRFCWGMTATPCLYTDSAHHLYWVLTHEKAHHPNLLHQIMTTCVRLTRPTTQLSAHVASVPCPRNSHPPNASMRVGVENDLHATVTDDVCVLEARCMTERVKYHVRALRTCVDEASYPDDAAITRRLHDEEQLELRMNDEIRGLLAGESACGICYDTANVLLECAHPFCRMCMERYHTTESNGCPTCKAPFSHANGIVDSSAKLHRIAEFCFTLAEPALLFVQWKNMVRNVKSCLRGHGIVVYTLDGNAQQRKRALVDFAACTTGVLLLSLSDSFAGLHLTNCNHVMFSHAIVADREQVNMLEYQAIARCLRVGQERDVFVHSFIAKNSFEEGLWHHTHRLV